MTTELPPPLRIAIVGGGIAGLAAALSLVKLQKEGANIKIDVYEGAPKFAEIGAGVAFGPNAQRALRLVGKGAGDVLKATAGDGAGDPDTWFYMAAGEAKHPRVGEVIRAIKGTDAARGSVHRADFLDGLINLLPPSLAHFNARCSSYTPHASGITLHILPPVAAPSAPTTDQKESTLSRASLEETVTAKGYDVEADILIASDGIRSLVRKHLYQRKGLEEEKQAAVYSEWVAWRGMITWEQYREALGEGVDGKMMFFGLDKHILTFPVRQNRFINIVGFVRDAAHAKLNGRTGPWSEERPKDELMSDYEGFGEGVMKLLRCIEKPSIWGIFELKELEVAVDERMVLIGDAAHAMTPHQGSGAGQAVEDALFITHLLASPLTSSSPLSTRPERIAAALSAYTRSRQARGAGVARTSREQGLLYQFRGINGEGGDMEKITEEVQRRMQWIWQYDTEGELAKALKMLEE